MPCAESKGQYRRYARIGPGGWKCSCCTPASPSKMKPILRAWKRKERQDWQRKAQEELENKG